MKWFLDSRNAVNLDRLDYIFWSEREQAVYAIIWGFTDGGEILENKVRLHKCDSVAAEKFIRYLWSSPNPSKEEFLNITPSTKGLLHDLRCMNF